jgi:hypothetical protein
MRFDSREAIYVAASMCWLFSLATFVVTGPRWCVLACAAAISVILGLTLVIHDRRTAQ